MSDELDSPVSLLQAYTAGLNGYIDDPRERGIFSESQTRPVYSEPNTANSGENQYAALWQYAVALDRLSYTEVQTEPDCTSHASRNARDTSRAVQICLQRKPESFGIRGATEPTYGARGHRGGGMSPARAAMFENQTGFLIRKKYDAVDLSKYNGAIGDRWGGSGVPEAVQKLCNENKVGIIRQIRSIRDARDALFNGYALMTGQHAAWDAKPNKDHYHPRVSPGWNHAMCTVGMDSTRKFWPFNVFFIANSWGAWNQLPKEWPDYLPKPIPGLIVCREEDYAVCIDAEDAYAYGSVDGFPPQKLPDMGAIGLLNV